MGFWFQNGLQQADNDSVALLAVERRGRDESIAQFLGPASLVQAGRPLPEVAALAGHRDIKMTLRYAHLAPSHLRAGIQALEDRQVGLPAGVIHRSPCHAGVTGFVADRVSAGVPNGI